ncbi:MAG: hypothetical protein O2960_28840 [Verrucomicrobia bacterium]|nr:hypothetical protein [Verrucomicrobiota bacterium]
MKEIIDPRYGDVLRALTISPKSDSLVIVGTISRTTGFGFSITQWKIPDGTFIRTFPFHKGAIVSVSGSDNSSVSGSVATDKTVTLWNPSNGSLKQTFSVGFVPRSISVSKTGDFVSIGGDSGLLELYDVKSQKALWTNKVHLARINSVAISPNSDLIASAGDDLSIKLLSISGVPRQNILGHSKAVKGIAFSSKGDYLQSFADDGNIKLWRVADGMQVGTFQLQGVCGAAWSPDQKAAAASSNGTVVVYNPFSGLKLNEIKLSKIPTGIKFNSDGTLLVVSTGNYLSYWRASDLALVRYFEGETTGITSIDVKRQGAECLVGRSDGTVLYLRNPGLDSVLERPSLSPLRILPDGMVRVTLSGDAGCRYIIEGSSNLKDWLHLREVVMSTGSIGLNEIRTPQQKQYFYRARLGL